MQLVINLTQRTFTIVQISLSTAIILAGLAAYLFEHFTGHGSLMGFLWLLNVESEQSIPTYFSVLNLLLSALLLFIIYIYEKKNKSKHYRYWLFLSLLFLFLSIDESASIHENFQRVHETLVSNNIIPSLLDSHQWLPFGILFVLAVGIVTFPFLIALPSKTRLLFLLSALVFLIGAMGFEYLGSWMLTNQIVETRVDLAYKIRRIFEEGFEIYGIVLFNCVLYREILNRKISLNLNISN